MIGAEGMHEGWGRDRWDVGGLGEEARGRESMLVIAIVVILFTISSHDVL